MTDADVHRTLLSVRADAQLDVEPDLVRVVSSLTRTAPNAATARDAIAQLLQRVTDQLAGHGGTALTAASGRSPLTWSADSLHAHSEQDHDQRGRPVGEQRYRASVDVTVTVRDFALLVWVQLILTGEDGIELHSMSWDADADNPGWAQVRADAITAALRKGQDYAAALGGHVLAVEHVADAGLLGSTTEGRSGWVAQSAAAFGKGGGGGGDAASLDPVPQTLTATIDARLSATVGPLPSA